MLTVDDLRVAYGAIEVIHGISLEVQEGECVALIGANGAGKSSEYFNATALCSPIPPHYTIVSIFFRVVKFSPSKGENISVPFIVSSISKDRLWSFFLNSEIKTEVSRLFED